ncbi:MAG: helix-turn-helix domain-containing protein [Lautropia sp.]|nr:helix-turn-helix domain-containing protein [Lautropia sp.]
MLLKAFGVGERALSLQQLADRTGMVKSTMLRLLRAGSRSGGYLVAGLPGWQSSCRRADFDDAEGQVPEEHLAAVRGHAAELSRKLGGDF